MNDSVPTKKDLALKLLMRHRDVAASIFNAVIYDGKPVIRASDLCDRSPVTSYNTGTVLHGLYRDVTKILNKEHAKLCIVSVENQSHIDKHIVLRNAGYDGGDYRDQAEKPEDPVPVLTLVLYYGTQPWNAPATLYEAMDIPEELRPFVSDYRANIIDLLHIDDSFASKFKGDFGYVLNALRNMENNSDSLDNLYHLKHGREVLQVLNEFYPQQFEYTVQSEVKEGAYSMRHFLSKEERMKMRAEGKEEGRAEGEADGILKGIARSVWNLMQCMNIPQSEALRLLRVSEKDIPAVIEHLKLLS